MKSADAERPARVARSRLNPQILERPLAQDPPVRHAVKRDAAGQAQLFLARFCVHVPGHPQQDLFGDDLDRRGQIHFALGEQCLRAAGRAAEELVEPLRRHRQALAVVEVRHVHAERAVVLQVDEFFENQIDVARARRRGPGPSACTRPN